MEKLKDTECIETLKEIQGRVTSIALVHEELYRSPDLVTLDFSTYIERMIKYLLIFYSPEKNINLKLNVEKIFIGIDTAIPLGIILNEIISNAVDYAFPNKSEGEISVNLCETENYKRRLKKSGSLRKASKCQNDKHFQYVLIIKDNGVGFPKDINFKETTSLGLQIVNLLNEQIEGCIELETNKGTKFSIFFNNLNK
jgi:two-component system, sensor histidine kinase PdtaS